MVPTIVYCQAGCKQSRRASSKRHSNIIMASRLFGICRRLGQRHPTHRQRHFPGSESHRSEASLANAHLPGGFMIQPTLKIRALACAFALVTAVLPSMANGDEQFHHVLLLSIDGLHAQDLARYIRVNPSSALAQLTRLGITY